MRRHTTRGIPRATRATAIDRAVDRIAARVLSGELALADAVELARMLDVADDNPRMPSPMYSAARVGIAR